MSLSFEQFTHELTANDIPEAAKAILRRSLVDTMGVAALGSTTELSGIVRTVADRFWRASPEAGSARMLFDGRGVSAAGAAFAGAFTVDSIDAHDGSTPCKGHAGSAVFPGVLAVVDALHSLGKPVSPDDLMLALAIGYEVSYRCGLTLHGTAPDYHTSGAWTAVGVAAAASRLLGLSPQQIRHAAGIAEYHGPRSQMMRCIDHPTMLRDGVGWGAPSGVTAAYMAELGFTGAPAITAEGEAAAPWWSDLGVAWRLIEDTHYKRYPVCRWAQPAIDAVSELMQKNGITSGDVARVTIRTFHYAIRLAGHDPKTLDEMTYAIVFPVATMIARGRIGAAEMLPSVLDDAEIRRIANATDIIETEEYTKMSVRRRWGDATLHLKDGREFTSGPKAPRGDPEDPLTEDEFAEKYRLLVHPALGSARAGRIEQLGLSFDALDDASFTELLELVLTPVPEDAGKVLRASGTGRLEPVPQHS